MEVIVINKRHSQKYGHVPSKLVITNPWKALCVNLIGPYTLIGKDRSSIDFMCLTMINPESSWFKIVELPSVDKATFLTMSKGKKVTCDNNTLRMQLRPLTSHLCKSVT